MSESTPILPPDPWYLSPVQVSQVIALVSGILSLLFGIVGYIPGFEITTQASDAIVAKVSQVLTLGATLAGIVIRGRSPVHPLTLTAARAEAKRQGGFVRPMMLCLIAVIAFPVFASLPACSTAPGPASRATIETTVRIAVRHAVADSPRATEKAANIRKVIAQAQAASDAATTLVGLESLLRAEVGKLELSPVDRADADDLISLLAVALESGYGDETLDGFVQVSQFLDLVLRALPA